MPLQGQLFPLHRELAEEGPSLLAAAEAEEAALVAEISLVQLAGFHSLALV
jgi:hypothetical protein